MKQIWDLALASYLVTIGHRIVKIEPDGRRSVFLFGESKDLDANILAFYNRAANVDPLSFAETMRNLKALVLRG